MNDDVKPASGRDRLVESLWLDARREADQELQKARAEAEKMEREDRRHRDQEMSLAIEKARLEAGLHVSRILNRAHSHVRRLLLEGCYSFLESCFDEARETIGSDPVFREKARNALPRMLKQSLFLLDGYDDIQIRINPDEVEDARKILSEEGLAHEIIADEGVAGGVMISAGDGSMVVDSTVDGKLKNLRDTPPVDLLKLIAVEDNSLTNLEK